VSPLPIVEDLDVFEDALPRLRLGVEGLEVHEFSFQRTEERLHYGIIETTPLAAHALANTPHPEEAPHF
jgi:hypothetical protein